MKYLKLFENLLLTSKEALLPENYEKYINYNIGDVVELVGIVDDRDLDNHFGEILNIRYGDGDCGEITSPYFQYTINYWIGTTIHIKFKDDISDYNNLTWYVSPYNIKFNESSFSSKRKKIKKPEIDPFDEEKWGWIEED